MKSNIAEKGLHSLLSLLTISQGPKMTLKALMGLNFQTQGFVFPSKREDDAVVKPRVKDAAALRQQMQPRLSMLGGSTAKPHPTVTNLNWMKVLMGK